MINKCEYCGATKPEVLSEIRRATTPPSITEQARQLVNEFLVDADTAELTKRIASFAAEAATQGQQVGIERAAELTKNYAVKESEAYKQAKATLKVDFTDPQLRFIEGAAAAAEVLEQRIRALSPDPSYLDRVRDEAATAALEQGVTPEVARKLLHMRDAIAKEDYREAWHDLYSIANPKFDSYEPWAELERIAAVGDDGEHRNRD